MGCCGGSNNQDPKVKEWGSNEASGNGSIKFLVIGLILMGIIIYKFTI